MGPCPPALSIAAAGTRPLAAKGGGLVVPAGRVGAWRAAGALLDAVTVVEVALVEQGLRGLRTRLLAYQPVDACLCRASQIAVALREVYVLEGVVAVLIAGGTVRVGLRDAAVQGGLTVVGTGG